MIRVYASEKSLDLDEESNGMIDALLAFVARLENVPTFNLINNGQIIISYEEAPVQISADIHLKIDHLTFTKSGTVETIKLSLISNTITASELATFVKKIYADHLQELKNSLGDSIYYFDQKSRDVNVPPPMTNSAAELGAYKRMVIQVSPKQLSFTMTPFYSNKSFANIYGKEVREIERRVNFFLENKAWYDKKGIPYQLGLLLSGMSGSGKTSVIRAIANKTKRHIINVNFANITTASQLKAMFFSDRIQVFTDATMTQSQSYFIPVQQRLYVLEEIDALGDIVKQRTGDSASTETINDELTLGEILAVFDGTMEVPGRMIIMTTNHPEVLDQALIRPGRIDIRTHFGAASRDLITDMFKGYIDRSLSTEYKCKLPHEVLSPAEVGQVLFRHFGTDHRDADIVEDLVRTAGAKSLSDVPEYSDGSETEETVAMHVHSSDPETDETWFALSRNVSVTMCVHAELVRNGYYELDLNTRDKIRFILETNGGIIDDDVQELLS